MARTIASSNPMTGAPYRRKPRGVNKPGVEVLGRVDPPGSPGGPCQGCRHRLCILQRVTAESRCTACRQPIGYDATYIAGAGIRHDRCGPAEDPASWRRPVRPGVKGQSIHLPAARRPPQAQRDDTIEDPDELGQVDDTVRDIVARRVGADE